MSIKDQVKEDMKTAMKAKDTLRLEVIRGILSEFTNELVASGKTPQDEIDDESAMKVISRASKQRKDSIEQFEKGGRQELADKEKEELAIIEKYLPEMLGEEEIQKVIDAKKAEMGIEDKSQMGMFIGAVMKELKGQADGSVVKALVEKSLE